MKTWSLIFNWNDRDKEQGTFSTCVRAENHEEAEKLGRLDMRAFHLDAYPPENGQTEDEACELYEDLNLDGEKEFGGSLVDISEGAVWKAQELEDALRGLVDNIELGIVCDGGTALEKAKALLTEIDNIGTENEDDHEA